MKLKNLICLLVFLMSFSAIASPSLPAYSVQLSFSKGQESLSLRAKNKIRALFAKARKVGQIQSAKIITWADQLQLKHRPVASTQLKLVEDRNDNVEHVLEDLDLQMVVRKISMAEKPEVMDGLLAPEDLRLKKRLQRGSAAPSKSILFFIVNKNKK